MSTGRSRSYLVALLLLAFTAAPKAANPGADEPDPYTIEYVAKIIKYIRDPINYISGLVSGVKFLTGVSDQKITLADIKKTFENAEKEDDLNQLIARTNSALNSYDDIRRDASDAIKRANRDDLDVLTQRPDLITNLDLLRSKLNDLLAELEPFVSPTDATPENNLLAHRAVPTYIVLLPIWAATQKLHAELTHSSRRVVDETISKQLVTAQQNLFLSAGAYLLYAYEPGQSPSFFYSPVGEDGAWMDERPLYGYYNINAFLKGGGGGFSITNPTLGGFGGPRQPFSAYQELPVAKLALNILENIVKIQRSMVWAEKVYVWNLYTSPTDDPHTTRRAPFVFGQIIQVYY